MKKIFQPLKFGPHLLKNRVALASMTRCRADYENGNPNDLMKEYYSQRADSAGLVLTECLFMKKEQNCYIGAGGVATKENAAGWRKIVDSVHKLNVPIFAQIYHPGRSLHPDVHNVYPIAPSPIKIQGKTFVRGAFKEYVVPREMTEKDIKESLNLHHHAAKITKEAGFDGIELHAANGYLVDEFLRTSANQRTDQWGGSIENRARYCLEAIDKFAEVFPYEKIGIKLSLASRFQSMKDEDPLALGKYLLKELDKRGILYVQLAEAEPLAFVPKDNGREQIPNCAKAFRPYFNGFLITNGFGSVEEGIRRVEEGEADIASFAQNFIANPDLVERLKSNIPLTPYDQKYWYSPGPQGYTDYPKHTAPNKN